MTIQTLSGFDETDETIAGRKERKAKKQAAKAVKRTAKREKRAAVKTARKANKGKPRKERRAAVKTARKSGTTKVKAARKQVRQVRKENRKEWAGQAWNNFKKLNPLFAAGRNAFLVLTKLNFRGYATKLASQDRNKVSAAWKKVGGDPSKLFAQVNQGKGKKPLLGGRVSGIGYVPGIGAEPVTTSALLASAAGIIAALVDSGILTKKQAEGIPPEALEKFDTELDKAKETLTSAAPEAGEDTPQAERTAKRAARSQTRESGNDSGGGFKITPTVGLGLGAAAIAAIALSSRKPKSR